VGESVRFCKAYAVINNAFFFNVCIFLYTQGFNSAWIETQLAHVDKNAIRGTYNHAHYLEGRRKMMQWYGDYIDGLASAGNVLAGSFSKAA